MKGCSSACLLSFRAYENISLWNMSYVTVCAVWSSFQLKNHLTKCVVVDRDSVPTQRVYSPTVGWFHDAFTQHANRVLVTTYFCVDVTGLLLLFYRTTSTTGILEREPFIIRIKMICPKLSRLLNVFVIDSRPYTQLAANHCWKKIWLIWLTWSNIVDLIAPLGWRQVILLNKVRILLAWRMMKG